MTDHDPNSVIEATYNGNNVIHYVCKLGNAEILQVTMYTAIGSMEQTKLVY